MNKSIFSENSKKIFNLFVLLIFFLGTSIAPVTNAGQRKNPQEEAKRDFNDASLDQGSSEGLLSHREPAYQSPIIDFKDDDMIGFGSGDDVIDTGSSGSIRKTRTYSYGDSIGGGSNGASVTTSGRSSVYAKTRAKKRYIGESCSNQTDYAGISATILNLGLVASNLYGLYINHDLGKRTIGLREDALFGALSKPHGNLSLPNNFFYMPFTSNSNLGGVLGAGLLGGGAMGGGGFGFGAGAGVGTNPGVFVPRSFPQYQQPNIGLPSSTIIRGQNGGLYNCSPIGIR